MKKILLAVLTLMVFLSFKAQAQLAVSTLPASGLNEPYNIVEDTNYNLYLSDSVNNRILRIDGNNQTQTVLVGAQKISGAKDGPAYNAQFNNPQGLLAVTINGTNGLLVADTGNQLIRFVRLSDGYVTTLAGMVLATGSADNAIGTNATFTYPYGLTQDTNGNVYICDLQTSKIRVMNLNDPHFGVATLTVTGTSLKWPQGVAFMGTNQLWVADTGNNTIKLITLTSATQGSLTTYMGSPANGTQDSDFGSEAGFNQPSGLLWVPGFGLLISDTGNNSIRLATNNPIFGATNYAVVTFAGSPAGTSGSANGSLLSATFNSPIGLCLAPASGAFFVADRGNNLIRQVADGLPLPPPPPPVILTVTTNVGVVNLTWTTLSTATNYNVKRSGTSGTETFLASTSSTNYSDTSVLDGSTYYYVVSATDAGGEGPNSTEVIATAPFPQVPTPQIGYVDFPATAVPQYSSVFHQVSSATFNNDVNLVIKGTNGSQTYYTTDGSTPSPTNPSTASITSGYQDGISSLVGLSPYLVNQTAPSLTITAIGLETNHPSSAVVAATFQFVAGNPTIIGNNAAQFFISDITANANLYYTIDGTTPSATNGINLGTVASPTNFWTVNLNITTNTLFKVIAVRPNYQDSFVASTTFSPSNFVANIISFGFGSGEASSDFVASPGQTFYAPVTLSMLSGVNIYSLQFNLTVTNGGPNPGPAISPGAFGFSSMLMEPIPKTTPVVYEAIPPAMFIAANPVNPVPVALNGLTNFTSLTLTNTSINLLGVGWLERAGETNLYDTTKQNLITYSMAHDDLFPGPQQPNGVIAGGYAFQVPGNAGSGQTYRIEIGRPTATDDGIGAPNSDVYIAAPTNGAMAGGLPLNAVKYVTIGQRKYIAGSAYPFRWFNAGDFGSSNIVNADVLQVFQSAVYNFNTPPPGSDFFDAMDSCGNIGVYDSSHGYYTNANGYPYSFAYTITNYTCFYDATSNLISSTTDVVNLNREIYMDTLSFSANSTTNSIYTGFTPPITNVDTLTTTYTFPNPYVPSLFDGNDGNINQIAFGDGVLDICDVYVTFRRSLDPSLYWFERYWANGQRVADTGAPNISGHLIKAPLNKTEPKVQSSSTVSPQVNFAAGDITNGSAGQVVQVPISATIFGDYPLRALMLNLSVVPLDGSPALTTPIQFTQNATVLGSPYTTYSTGNGNYAAVWLNTTNAGLTGIATIGTLTVTLPAGVSTNSAYAIHFDHASASPNGIASFPKQMLTGLITSISRTNSSFNDGIPDSWRLRWFGTINNLLSASNACPSGDGICNWQKYVASVDPTVANDFPSLNPKTPVPSGASAAIHWPTVSGKQYVILNSTSLFPGQWVTNAIVTGTGSDMEFDDSSSGTAKFYRVQILP